MPYNQHLNVNVKKRDYKSREMTSCQSIFRYKEAEEKFKEFKFHSLAKGTDSEFMGKTFQAAQLTHERFLTKEHSCKIFF